MNVKGIDRNVRALNAVESMWGLPALPDMVKLDLASMSGLTVEGIQEFAWGLNTDIETAQQPAPAKVPTIEVADPTALTTGERIHQVAQGIAGHPAPKRLEGPRSVQAWKERAVGLGYLDAVTPMDSSWNPAFNTVLHQMRMDDYNRRITGDRPGPSASIGEVAEFFDNWLSPTGLLHAAMDLDFLPDPQRIASEWDKGWWRALDDIALPVVNTALLFTGIGEVAAFAKGLNAAHKGLKGWELANGARKVGTLGRIAGRTADVGTDLTRIQQPGLLGARLRKAGEGTLRHGMGSRMEAWRQLRGTMLTKKTVQQGMRLGFTSRLEDRFFDVEGYGLPDEWVDAAGSVRRHPAVWLLGEMAFTPVTILEPGQIGSPFGFVKRFANVGGDAQFGEEAAEAVRYSILNPVDDVASDVATHGDIRPRTASTLEERQAEVKAFDARVKRLGHHGAVKERFGFHPTGDDEKYQAWLTWMVTMAAVDARAAGLVVEATGEPLVKTALRFRQDFHTARNNLIAQLRYIDPDNPEELLWGLAWSRARNPQHAKQEFARLHEGVFGKGDEVDELVLHGLQVKQENLAELIDIHNEQRLQVWQQLLDDHAKPGVLSNQMAHTLDTMGAWDDFTRGMDEVNDAFVAGGLTGAKFRVPVSPETGRPVQAIKGHVVGDAKPPRFEGGIFTVDVTDILSDREFIEFSNSGIFKPFLHKTPENGRFTVARLGTATKQDKLTEYAVIRRLFVMRDTVRRTTADLRKVMEKAEKHFTAEGAGFTSIRVGQLDRIMEEMGVVADTQRRIRRIHAYVRKHNLDPSEVAQHVADRIRAIDESSHWSSKYGIDSTLDLRKKMKELRRQAAYTASEVDPESIPAELAQTLAAKGYKLVHGVEFAAPNDLKELMVEIADLVDLGKYNDSFGVLGGPMAQAVKGAKRGVRGLGRAVQRAQPTHATLMYRGALRNGLQRSLLGVAKPGKNRNYRNPAGEDLSRVIDELERIVRDIAEDNTKAVRKKRDLAALDPRRMITNVQSAFAPAQPADLVRTMDLWNYTDSALANLGYLKPERLAIFDGLKSARVAGPQLRGRFTHWLDKLQATPALTNTMRLLGRQTVDGGFGASSGAFSVKAAPAIAGGYAYGAFADRDREGLDGFVQDFAAALTAVGFGRVAGGKAIERWMGATSKATRFNVLGRAAAYMDTSKYWKHWSYLPDRLATARDYFRFSLSPIFDASRFSEAAVLTQIGDLPADVLARGGLRFNMSPTAWRRQRVKELTGKSKSQRVVLYQHKGSRLYTAQEAKAAGLNVDDMVPSTWDAAEAAKWDWDRAVDEFAAIASGRHDFDYAALEAGTARFRQIGILGFNTHEWMASMYADLTRLHGIDPQRAYEISRKAFTYGINPRSPAEMNVNAVFFPFSFGKKTASHVVNFAKQDWSRAAMIHDAIKTYEMLNKRYDLNELWKDHLPVLNKLHRLNLFAYGVSPGELGGANRPFVDFFNSTPAAEGITDPIFNIFLPQGYDIRAEEDMFNVEKLMRRVAPVFNDMQHLLDDMAAQGHVLTSGTWMTKEAEASEGFRLVAETERLVHDMLVESGVREGIGAIRRKRYAPLKQWLDGTKEEIRDSLPGYREALVDVITNSVIAGQERRELEAAFTQAGAPVDRYSKVGYLLTVADQLADSAGGIDYVTPDARDAFLTIATSWARDDDYVRMKWRQHLRRLWGPIETELV